MRRLWLIQAGGNLLLLALIYIWLGIRDARTIQLVATAILGGLIAFIALWLHAANFTYFADNQPSDLTAVFRHALQRLVSFTAVVILFLLFWWALNLLDQPLHRAAQWLASTLTFRSRKPIRPALIATVFSWLLWYVMWVKFPILLLPVASKGFTRASLVQTFRPRFWLEYLLTIAACFYLPYRLIHYAPQFHNTAAEIVSFVLRFGLAYFLLVTGWLALAFFSSGGRPRVIQPTTVASP